MLDRRSRGRTKQRVASLRAWAQPEQEQQEEQPSWTKANAATAANWHDNSDLQTRGMLGVAVKLTREPWAMKNADVNVLRSWA